MKKIISGLFFGLIFFATPVFAEDTATLTLQNEYQKALVQLIGLLQQQVLDLMAQLKTMQETQKSIETKIDTQVTQPTPVAFGATVVEKVALVPTTIKVDTLISEDTSTYPNGWYIFNVSVLDQEGTTIKKVVINMDNPSDNLFKSTPGDFDKEVNGSPATFQYMPSTKGTKNITFSVGNVSTTTIIEVK